MSYCVFEGKKGCGKQWNKNRVEVIAVGLSKFSLLHTLRVPGSSDLLQLLGTLLFGNMG